MKATFAAAGVPLPPVVRACQATHSQLWPAITAMCCLRVSRTRADRVRNACGSWMFSSRHPRTSGSARSSQSGTRREPPALQPFACEHGDLPPAGSASLPAARLRPAPQHASRIGRATTVHRSGWVRGFSPCWRDAQGERCFYAMFAAPRPAPPVEITAYPMGATLRLPSAPARAKGAVPAL